MLFTYLMDMLGTAVSIKFKSNCGSYVLLRICGRQKVIKILNVGLRFKIIGLVIFLKKPYFQYILKVKI
jgi:hypothetical protein